MTAKCSICSKHWIISVLAVIPKKGYECPRCAHRRRKKKRARDGGHRQQGA